MAITAGNYVFNATTPTAPRISVDANTSTTAAITQAVTDYTTAATAYAAVYTTAGATRDYVLAMFEKDACADSAVQLATINKVTNEYTANIKANDYFDQARGTTALTTEAAVTGVYTTLKNLKTKLFDDENVSGIEYGGDNWTVNKTMPTATYDTKAITVPANTLTGVDTATYFINDVAKNTGDARTFTAYQSNGTTTTPKYTLKKTTDGWEIKEGTTVLKISANIDASPIVWTDPTEE